MEKTLSASEAQSDFGKILDMVSKGDAVVIEHNGKPAVAILPIEAYRQWQQGRRVFFDTMRDAAERADMSEEEADELIEEAIRAVRSRQTVIEKMREMAGQSDMSPEEADELAAEAVQWARSHRES